MCGEVLHPSAPSWIPNSLGSLPIEAWGQAVMFVTGVRLGESTLPSCREASVLHPRTVVICCVVVAVLLQQDFL